MLLFIWKGGLMAYLVVKINDDLNTELKEYCKRFNINKSALIRDLIRKKLKK